MDIILLIVFTFSLIISATISEYQPDNKKALAGVVISFIALIVISVYKGMTI